MHPLLPSILLLKFPNKYYLLLLKLDRKIWAVAQTVVVSPVLTKKWELDKGLHFKMAS